MKFRWETEFKKTEIGEMPKDWEVKPLGEVVTFQRGYDLPLKLMKGGPYPVVKSNGIAGYHNEFKAKGPGITLGRSGSIGKPFYVEVDYWPHNTTLFSTRFHNSHPKFVYHLLTIFSKVFEEYNAGSAVPTLNRNHIHPLPVAIPPTIEEQTRIATVLSWFDDLIENKKKQNEILEKMAMVIFKSWFVDFEPFQDEEFVYSEELGMEIPEGWEVKPIGEVADFTNGLSYKGSEKLDEYEDGAYVFITLNNIEERGGFKSEFAWIKSDRLKERHFIREGDLIFANTEQTKTGRLLASPAIVIFPPDYEKDRGVYSHHITKLSPKEEHLKLYLYSIFKTQQESIAQIYHTGTGVWGFDLKNFEENYSILIPPQPILQRFHSLVEPLFHKIFLNQKQILTLKKIRDALLPQLVFGRLRIEEL